MDVYELLEVGHLPRQEAYARFTDEKGRIIAGQFKTRLDVFAAKINDTVVRVGVNDPSQVEKAIIHEIGTNHTMTFEEDGKVYKVKGVPARSFIRMPLALFLPRALEEIKLINPEDGEVDFEEIAKALGETSVEVIHDAFESQGFGNWLPHQNPEYAKENDNPVLDRTGKLKNSIDYEVINKGTM